MKAPYPIIDGHNDTLLSLLLPTPGEDRSFFERSEFGQLDLPRARAGGMAGGFFAMFSPTPSHRPKPKLTRDGTSWSLPLSSPIDHTYALEFVTQMMGLAFEIERESEGEVGIVRSCKDLLRNIEQNRFSMILHVEGAEAIDVNLRSLEVLYQAGLRSLGPVWSRPNIFGHGVPFSYPTSPDIGPGLTSAGKRLIQRCNELGIMVDLSHLNERGFWDVAELSTAPLVATHCCAHSICPSARNLTDAQLDRIVESGGVVGMNFYVGDVRGDGVSEANTSLDAYGQQLDYLVERMGSDHVAFGSDFDGAPMANPLADVAHLPDWIRYLQQAGYSSTDLNKLTHQNWLRVLDASWHEH